MPNAPTEADDTRELCQRLVAAATREPERVTPLRHARAPSYVVREAEEAYVVKLLPGSRLAELKGRLSAWKHTVIDRDAGAPHATRRERIRRFHTAVRVWGQYGFGRNVPTLVSSPEDDFIVYRYIEGPSLRDAVTGGEETTPADMAPIEPVLAHMQARHRVALTCPDPDDARGLVHQDPHQFNIIMRDGVPVFVDLDEPLSERLPVPDLVGRELAVFARRVLRLAPRDQVLEALDAMMRWYADRDTWRRAAEFLGRRRRIQLLGFARRRQRSITKLALAEAICARLS